MRTIVLSKQCDYDADLFALWTKWYREIFPADQIVLTPVRIKGSPVGIDKTLGFYQSVADVIEIIEVDSWNAVDVWRAQLKILRRHLDLKTFWVSADTDQFFDLSSVEIKNDIGAFQRNELFVFSEIRPDNVLNVPIYEVGTLSKRKGIFREKLGKVGGAVGRVNREEITATGHLRVSGQPVGTEYHLTVRGEDQFVKKVSTFTKLSSGGGSEHYRRWRGILKTKGEEGLRKQFRRFFESHEKTEHSAFKEFFA